MAPVEGKEAQKEKKLLWINWYVYNKLTSLWNNTFGSRYGMMTPIKREGGPQPSSVAQQLNKLYAKNDGMIVTVSDIESKWAVIETLLFSKATFKHKQEPDPNSEVFSELYRTIEYFRDEHFAKIEAEIFKEKGTVKEVRKITLQKKNPNDANVKILRVDIGEVIVPFVSGEPERLVAIGAGSMSTISGFYDETSRTIDHLASAGGIPPAARTPITQLMDQIKSTLKMVREIEEEHGLKVEQIQKRLVNIKDMLDAEGLVEKNRPKKELVRFAHTYKIINPFRIVEKRVNGKIIKDAEYFKDKYSAFKRGDELEAGIDENRWPLEVYEEGGSWFVLTDKWWAELSVNDWHEKTIKGKPGGKEIWTNKVDNGVKVKKAGIEYKEYLGRYIRKVPEEFVGDVDPLAKISFISNETDAFRDDFRDGRYHPHSKSSMDYIIAGTNNITPTQQINFKIDTMSPEVRIKFRPIYFTPADTLDKSKWGEVNPKGGMGSITLADIPKDEREVSRRYEMETEFGKLENQVRQPKHLNPALDRAALLNNHDYVHWGRMLYYETSEGLNRWSENPFPHVTTRGIAKYLIDLTIRKTFSFEEARAILASGHKWDFGVRHYGEPFIADPLGPAAGPGGALSHAYARRSK